jgi:hypothetical protein
MSVVIHAVHAVKRLEVKQPGCNPVESTTYARHFNRDCVNKDVNWLYINRLTKHSPALDINRQCVNPVDVVPVDSTDSSTRLMTLLNQAGLNQRPRQFNQHPEFFRRCMLGQGNTDNMLRGSHSFLATAQSTGAVLEFVLAPTAIII